MKLECEWSKVQPHVFVTMKVNVLGHDQYYAKAMWPHFQSLSKNYMFVNLPLQQQPKHLKLFILHKENS